MTRQSTRARPLALLGMHLPGADPGKLWGGGGGEKKFGESATSLQTHNT